MCNQCKRQCAINEALMRFAITSTSDRQLTSNSIKTVETRIETRQFILTKQILINKKIQKQKKNKYNIA